MFLMLYISTIMIFFNHPLSLGFSILIQTILSGLVIGMFSYNFWFSYILLLIMIGGLLILFIYMTSIASNEKFKFSLMMTILLPIFFIMSFFINTNLNYYLLNSFNLKMSTIFTYNLSMSKYYNFPSLMIMMFTIIYLLITLIAVVKICKINSGPLRQMFYENTYTKIFPRFKNCK
uniref:NADH-ubiquinone oxidoreductase chain 6 n=1 Tax=Coccinellidae sp. 1 EF-2015 TaxID=1756852 RepID=A0A0S2M6Z2_9CUCU|nr:NADH deshydrogenase subunit 6 [Coccinellidae sp. 1 EF-2015]